MFQELCGYRPEKRNLVERISDHKLLFPVVITISIGMVAAFGTVTVYIQKPKYEVAKPEITHT